MSTFVLADGMTLARLTPQPFTPWAERADMRRFLALRMPCTYP